MVDHEGPDEGGSIQYPVVSIQHSAGGGTGIVGELGFGGVNHGGSETQRFGFARPSSLPPRGVFDMKRRRDSAPSSGEFPRRRSGKGNGRDEKEAAVLFDRRRCGILARSPFPALFW